MTQKENTGISSELQTVLLDEHNFLKTLVQECLQQLLKSEFDRHINAAPRRGDKFHPYLKSCLKINIIRFSRRAHVFFTDLSFPFHSQFM